MMRKGVARRSALWSVSVAVLLMMLAGCSPKMNAEVDAEDSDPVISPTTQIPGGSGDSPWVITLEDGRQVQKTPDDLGQAVYQMPKEAVSYNMQYLKADERGCTSCHADLAKHLEQMDYHHVDLTNDLGIDVTVQMCLDCHSYSPGYLTEVNGFGSLIHGIHNVGEVSEDAGACFTCHDATNDGGGMQLWDVVKHDRLRGITDVPNVTGDFSSSQDDLVPVDSLFNYEWLYWDYDYFRMDNENNDVPLDQERFDEWTITVTGLVDKEVTYTLPDLIAQAPSVTRTMKMQCVINPVGGPYIANCEVTGVPLSWLTDQAGIKPEAGSFTATCPDASAQVTLLENLEGREPLLVYEIDGKPLSWEHGYPVMLWIGGAGGAASNIKSVSDIIFNGSSAEEIGHQYVGWAKEDGGFYNKPNAGLWGTKEGEIINVGEPYVFSGYADGFDKRIAAVEFSMDGGSTWTHFDTPDTDVDKWITWEFAFTPEKETAYVLHVRAVSEDGTVTDEPVELMVNARGESTDIEGEGE